MIILAPSGPTQFDIQFMSISLSSVNDLHNRSCVFFTAESSVVEDIKIFLFSSHLSHLFFHRNSCVFVTTRSGKSHLAVRRVCPWPCISLLPHFHLKATHTRLIISLFPCVAALLRSLICWGLGLREESRENYCIDSHLTTAKSSVLWYGV